MSGSRAWAAGVVLALASACGQATAPGDSFTLPDTTADLHGATDAAGAADTPEDLATATDAAAADTPLDVPAPVDVAPDVASDTGPQDAPPTFQTPPPLTLAEGASTTLDLNPLLADLEDADAQLTVSWSAQHVALQDPGTHLVYVVAPTNWTGTEQVALTVHDSAGLTATATLAVTVTAVQIGTQPTDTCGKVTFSFVAGKGSHTVLLSGSFNGWASAAPAADVLTDPTNSGTWSVVRTLAAGVYQYKFIVDGKWQPDPSDPNQVPDGYGDKNSVVEVPACQP